MRLPFLQDNHTNVSDFLNEATALDRFEGRTLHDLFISRNALFYFTSFFLLIAFDKHVVSLPTQYYRYNKYELLLAASLLCIKFNFHSTRYIGQ